MYGCESWIVKKTERRRTDAFELWCWRRLLRVPWTARRSNQSIQPSILKEISPMCSLKGLMLKLKLQYFGHLNRRTDSLGKTLMLGKIEGEGEGDDRGWDGWMASPTQWTWVWVSSGSRWWTGRPGVLQSMGSQRIGHDWVTELNWIQQPGSLTWLQPGGISLAGQVSLSIGSLKSPEFSGRGLSFPERGWALRQGYIDIAKPNKPVLPAL